MINGNREFVVKWDIDQDTASMSLDKVRYEAVDTPLQSPATSVITAEDFEGMAGDLAQGNSADAARTHALLVENFAEDDLEDECRSQQTTAHHSTQCTLYLWEMVQQRKTVC